MDRGQLEVAGRWKDEVKACPAHKSGGKKRRKTSQVGKSRKTSQAGKKEKNKSGGKKENKQVRWVKRMKKQVR